MLRSIAKTLAVTVLAAGCSLVPMARAQGHPSYEASIPFAFYVSDTLLPAGTYQITQPSQNMLLIHNARGVAMVYQLVFAKQEGATSPTGQVTFTKYGSSYFLEEFSIPGNSSESHLASECVRGRMEKSAAKKYAGAISREVALNALPRR
jgi:hypothetical protein